MDEVQDTLSSALNDLHLPEVKAFHNEEIENRNEIIVSTSKSYLL